MALSKLLGRPVSFTTTGVTYTTGDLKECSAKLSAEVIKYYSGNVRFPRILSGKDESQLTITTGDSAVIGTLKQHVHLDTAVLVIESATKGTDGTADQSNATLTITFTDAKVVEAIEVASQTEGEPVTYKVVIENSVDPTTGVGTVPTFVIA